MKRLFIGVPVTCPNASARTLAWQNNHELNLNRLVWTKPSNWHFTLVFLGATPETAIASLCRIINQAFDQCSSYTTMLNGTGVFPNRHRPAVLWLGLDDIRPLLPSYQEMVELLNKENFPYDPKPLKPHLTIARVKSLNNRSSLDKLLDDNRHTSFGQVPINRIVLYESISSPNGVLYQPLYEKSLNGELL